MSIQDILDSKGAAVITIHPAEPIKSAVDRMRKHAIAALVVKSGEAVKGLISDRDIINAISQHGAQALTLPVSDSVTQIPITVSPRDSLRQAMSLMTSHRVRHLLVMSDSRLVGIISIGDVVKARLEDLESETNVLRDAYLAAH